MAQRATRAGADMVVMLGNEELATGAATLKLLSTGKQMHLPLPLLPDAVQAVVRRLANLASQPTAGEATGGM